MRKQHDHARSRSGKRIRSVICVGVLGVLLVGSLVQAIRCRLAIGEAEHRLERYHARTARLSYGDMTYVDAGSGEVILSAHGIFGGYDQAFDVVASRTPVNRIIAPSRFGYLGSDVLGGGTPREQAKAYLELLDHLGIDSTYVIGASAGGTVAMRFALDYPERTKGLILYSAAPPQVQRPESYAGYQGPPAFLVNDYAMYVLSPMFEPLMGMDPSTIDGMLPVSRRREGVNIDASITNPDMARNFDDYPIDRLQTPTLILHAKDDQLVEYADMERAVPRFPHATFVSFDSGGHLIAGHDEEIRRSIDEFIRRTSTA